MCKTPGRSEGMEFELDKQHACNGCVVLLCGMIWHEAEVPHVSHMVALRTKYDYGGSAG